MKAAKEAADAAYDAAARAIQKNELATATKMLHDNPKLAKQRDRYDYTLLHVAASAGRAKIVTLLLDAGADPNAATNWGSVVLESAVGAGKADIVELLLARGAKVQSAQRADYGALRSAVSNGNLEMVKLLLDKGADINRRDKSGETPIFAAGYKKEVLDFLLANGARVDIRNDAGQTLLFKINYQDEKQYSAIVKELVDRGLDINAASNTGDSALHLAAAHGISNVPIQILLANGAKPNLKNYHGDTPLDLCLRNGQPLSLTKESQKILIENSDLKLRDQFGLTPLMLALIYRHKTARDLIAQSTPATEPAELVFDLAAQNDSTRLRALLEKQPLLTQMRLPDGTTPLHLAALWAALDTTKLLVDFGADVNARDSMARTPLHRVLRKPTSTLDATDMRQTISALLTRNADVNATDTTGKTPLHKALALYDIESARLLLEKDADTKRADDDGNTMLHLALRSRNVKDASELARLFIEDGADVNALNKAGESPLVSAARNNNTAAILLLLSKGADINQRTPRSDAPLAAASYASELDAARLLIERGADVNALTDYQKPVLEEAVDNNNIELARLLIAKGANVNAEPTELFSNSQTPLTRAVYGSKKIFVELLLDHGADPNKLNREGEKPLAIAITRKNNEIAELLRRHGATE